MLAVADSDSYLKWAAATLAALPDGVRSRLVLVETPVLPSAAQREAALRGSGIRPGAVEIVAFRELPGLVAAERPDAVLVATRGPQAREVLRELAALEPRPVLVTGLPGISIPATRKALYFRAQADLFVVHSRREVGAFRERSRASGWDHRVALAGLPFVRSLADAPPARGGTDLVFAVQSIVPAELEHRREIARMLVRAAAAHPDRRVVVKVRAREGERQTHDEPHPIPELIAREAVGGVPANLVVSAEPMAHALDTAEGLVTVSSTAALEAIARRVPLVVLDTFGVDDRLINPVFIGSGLFGGADDVIARRFRHPDFGWLDDDYFHPASDDDLVSSLVELVAARRRGALPARPAIRVAGGALRLRWQRIRAFPGSVPGLAGVAVLLVGIPARAVVVLARRASLPIRRLRARRLAAQPTP